VVSKTKTALPSILFQTLGLLGFPLFLKKKIWFISNFFLKKTILQKYDLNPVCHLVGIK